MANRSIELSLKANVGQLVAGLATARQAVNDTAKGTAAFVRNNEQDMRTAGRTMVGFGAAMTAAAGIAVKAAIDWESSWADVQKVNDGTHDQMVRLEEDLREMARTIPATHEEIAAVAEAAGRLGVGVDDVADFSRVMIDLGNTTDLSADQAATALARFSNITGTSFGDADRLGATIVDLGNNFATTETEIIEMSQRLAAAGSQAGLSEGEIMGLATAMTSVGVKAEAGGTAMTKTFNEIDGAVREGGDSLEGWAELAGVSASEFADAWRNDPAEAIDMVIQGLAGVNESGGDVNGTLVDLGINGERQADTLRRLASASDVAGDAMAVGNEAFAENSALSEEAAIRYDTAAMKIKTAWASIVDAAITAGSSLAPIVGDVAEMAGGVADAFGKLPAPVLGAVTALSGVAGTALLAGGGLLMLAPSAVQTWDAFTRLSKSTRGLPRALRNVGKGAGIAAGAFVGLLVAREIADAMRPATATVDEMTNALNKLNNEGDSTDLNAMFDISGFGETLPWLTGYIEGIEDLGGALEDLDPEAPDEKFQAWSQEMLNLPGPLKDAREQIETLDAALSQMDADTAAENMRNLRDEAEAAGRQDFSNWEDLKELLPGYAAAIEEAATATGETVTPAELLEVAMGNLTPEMEAVADAADEAAQQDDLTGALEEVGVAADGTVESLSDYLDMLFQTGLANQSAMQASASYEEALDAVGDAVDTINDDLGGMNDVFDETTSLFNDSEPAGRAAQDAFLAVAKGGTDLAEAMAEADESQEDIQESLQGTYDDLIATAGEFGITGDAAEDLARHVLGVPDGVDIETWMDEFAQQTADELTSQLDEVPEAVHVAADMSDDARAKAWETAEAVDLIDDFKKVDIAISEDGTAGQVQTRVDAITGKEEFVFVTEDGTTTTVQQQIVNIDGKTEYVYVDDDDTVYSTQSSIDAIHGTDAAVDVDDYGTVTGTQDKINQIQDGDSFISVTDNASAAGSRIDTAARPRTATLTVFESIIKGKSSGGRAGLAAGGRAPRSDSLGLAEFAGGGRLPYTGLGTDQILGINTLGHPTAMVDDLEWVVNRRSSDKYDSVIDRINRDHPSVQHLAHLRDGGRANGRDMSAMTMMPSSPSIDYNRLAEVMGDRRSVNYVTNQYSANATMHDATDAYRRRELEESRR